LNCAYECLRSKIDMALEYDNLKVDGELRVTINSMKTIIESLNATLVTAAFLIIGDEDDAKDIVAGMYLEIWERSETLTFTSMAAFSGYVVKSVKNRALNYIRDNRRRSLILEEIYNSKNGKGLVDEFRREFLIAEIIADMLNAVKELPDQPKRTIELMLEDRKTDEIAEIMKISPKGVQRNKDRARSYLRKKLDLSQRFTVAMIVSGLLYLIQNIFQLTNIIRGL
jgi:RNA polymerase sigma factor (sigma-70 family)